MRLARLRYQQGLLSQLEIIDAERNLLQAETLDALRELIIYYNQLPTGLWDRLWVQPPHRLPLRILRKVGKELVRLW